LAIAFNKAWAASRELEYLTQALESRRLAGDGPFTKRCNALIESLTGSPKALLTHSCTAALEMAAILAGVGPGDEVILPSFTFVSTANAFVLRGAVPVFVDVRRDTLNLDEALIERAITARTRAIAPVHYAGVGCEMDRIMEIASRHGLTVIEDAAQGLCASYNDRSLGAIGALGTLSFHESKNVLSGEGGALLINDPALLERAEIVREKGTDRSRFLRGEVDKYTWVDVGSSFLPSELVAAVLCAQLEEAHATTARRLEIWNDYREALTPLERKGLVQLPTVPEGVQHNAHIFFMLTPTAGHRTALASELQRRGVGTASHYVPLHASPAGRRFGRAAEASLPVTESIAECMVRLPLWPGMADRTDDICREVAAAVEQMVGR